MQAGIGLTPCRVEGPTFGAWTLLLVVATYTAEAVDSRGFDNPCCRGGTIERRENVAAHRASLLANGMLQQASDLKGMYPGKGPATLMAVCRTKVGS